MRASAVDDALFLFSYADAFSGAGLTRSVFPIRSIGSFRKVVRAPQAFFFYPGDEAVCLKLNWAMLTFRDNKVNFMVSTSEVAGYRKLGEAANLAGNSDVAVISIESTSLNRYEFCRDEAVSAVTPNFDLLQNE